MSEIVVSPTALVRVKDETGKVKLVAMNRAQRRRLKVPRKAVVKR